jgi:hypothetical protein
MGVAVWVPTTLVRPGSGRAEVCVSMWAPAGGSALVDPAWKEASVDGLDRNQVHEELLAAAARYRQLVDTAPADRLSKRTYGTRWTNREMLFHLLMGYLVVRTLLPVVWLITRLPPWARRDFAATLEVATRPFHTVNYLGSVLGGHILSPPGMARLFDRTCIRLAAHLDGASDRDLTRTMPFPTRWDPFFTDRMSLLDVYHYPWQHFVFHRQQLTLDQPG